MTSDNFKTILEIKRKPLCPMLICLLPLIQNLKNHVGLGYLRRNLKLLVCYVPGKLIRWTNSRDTRTQSKQTNKTLRFFPFYHFLENIKHRYSYSAYVYSQCTSCCFLVFNKTSAITMGYNVIVSPDYERHGIIFRSLFI